MRALLRLKPKITKFSVVFTLALNFATAGAAAANSNSADVSKDFESLGDNAPIVERVRAANPDRSGSIVQNKIVNRDLRFELGVAGGVVAGGQSYFSTQNLGANLDFHINSHWSVGARYYHSYNQLTPEGQAVYSGSVYQTVLDSPIETGLVVVNWYPIYGKLAVGPNAAHFDIYTTVGYGKTNLSNSGLVDTYAAGGGMGIWWTQHFATRLEARYQTYQDQSYSGPQQVNSAVIMGSVGFLL